MSGESGDDMQQTMTQGWNQTLSISVQGGGLDLDMY